MVEFSGHVYSTSKLIRYRSKKKTMLSIVQAHVNVRNTYVHLNALRFLFPFLMYGIVIFYSICTIHQYMNFICYCAK